MASIDVKVPDIGDFAEVAVIEVMVKVGDAVKAEQSLITVESDKASMEIPSSHAGVVKALKVAVGDKVAMGSVIVELEAAASVRAEPVEAPAPPAPVRAEPVEAPASPSTSSGRTERPHPFGLSLSKPRLRTMSPSTSSGQRVF
jgi:pyruvate/2-oxoglutarate dehydrogenase complex dihydrolipoamide acyltransferase (E2) component